MLLNRVPVILQREIYASAALVGAAIETLGYLFGDDSATVTWLALATCFALRYASLRYQWNLPRFQRQAPAPDRVRIRRRRAPKRPARTRPFRPDENRGPPFLQASP